MFPKHILIADAQTGWIALVFQVLRRITDDAAGMELIARADRRPSRDVDVRTHDTFGSELDVRVYYRIRADLYARMHLCLWMNDGGWMNHGRSSSHAWRLLSSMRQRHRGGSARRRERVRRFAVVELAI